MLPFCTPDKWWNWSHMIAKHIIGRANDFKKPTGISRSPCIGCTLFPIFLHDSVPWNGYIKFRVSCYMLNSIHYCDYLALVTIHSPNWSFDSRWNSNLGLLHWIDNSTQDYNFELSWNFTSIQNYNFDLNWQSNAANSRWNFILKQMISFESVDTINQCHKTVAVGMA